MIDRNRLTKEERKEILDLAEEVNKSNFLSPHYKSCVFTLQVRKYDRYRKLLGKLLGGTK